MLSAIMTKILFIFPYDLQSNRTNVYDIIQSLEQTLVRFLLGGDRKKEREKTEHHRGGGYDLPVCGVLFHRK